MKHMSISTYIQSIIYIALTSHKPITPLTICNQHNINQKISKGAYLNKTDVGTQMEQPSSTQP
jgi:hypothetical protein